MPFWQVQCIKSSLEATKSKLLQKCPCNDRKSSTGTFVEAMHPIISAQGELEDKANLKLILKSPTTYIQFPHVVFIGPKGPFLEMKFA